MYIYIIYSIYSIHMGLLIGRVLVGSVSWCCRYGTMSDDEMLELKVRQLLCD